MIIDQGVQATNEQYLNNAAHMVAHVQKAIEVAAWLDGKGVDATSLRVCLCRVEAAALGLRKLLASLPKGEK